MVLNKRKKFKIGIGKKVFVVMGILFLCSTSIFGGTSLPDLETKLYRVNKSIKNEPLRTKIFSGVMLAGLALVGYDYYYSDNTSYDSTYKPSTLFWSGVGIFSLGGVSYLTDSYLLSKNRLNIKSDLEAQIYQLRKEVAEKKAEEDDYNKAISVDTIFAYYEFLDNYPTSDHKEEIRNKLQKYIPDENEYKKAIDIGTIESYKKYLSIYPNGQFREKINNIISDEQDWEEAKKLDNSSGYEKYEQAHSNGKYISQTHTRLKELEGIMTELYEKAIQSDSVSICEEFLKNYPNSVYVQEIKEKQEELQWFESNKRKKLENMFPKNFLDSQFIARIGISDFNGETVRDFFLYKDFEVTTTENVNGNIINITTQISNVKVSNNVIKFDITRFSDNKPVLGLFLKFTYLDNKSSLLDSIKIKNYESNQSDTISTFNEKMQVLAMLIGWY